MFASKPAELKRIILEPLAAEKGLVYDYEMLWPGARPEQTAFQLASCGASLLLGLSYREGFPAISKRVARRGARAIVSGIEKGGGRRAAVFLGQALATMQYETLSRAGELRSADFHLSFRELLQDAYPLPSEDRECLEYCRAEYRTIDTHEVREEVRIGVETGTGYHRALEDPDFLEGRDPDEDEEVVEVQKRYAGSFLRRTASLHTVELVVGAASYKQIRDELLRPGGIAAEGLVFDLGELSAWSDVAGEWSRFARIAIGQDDREPRPMPDELSTVLRSGVEYRLGNPESKMPDRASTAAGHFAGDLASAEVNWNAATDALIMGYYLREIECEVCEWNSFDPETADKLMKWAESDPDMAFAGAALSVADGIPNAFAAGGAAWDALSSWAADEALQRSWIRHRLAMEDGGPPGIGEEALRRAFALGYGIGFAKDTLGA